MGPDGLDATLRGLLASQRLAVLATRDREHPHTSLVAFAATEDLNLGSRGWPLLVPTKIRPPATTGVPQVTVPRRAAHLRRRPAAGS
jgi:hypothetical protein